METGYHKPVLLDESVSAMMAEADSSVDAAANGANEAPAAKVYVDCTFGGGGHSGEILRRMGPQDTLIAFDRDEDAIEHNPHKADSRLILERANFRFVHNFCLAEGFKDGVDAILADLGVSSHQFDTPERGFSFRFDAPLDMRMNNQAAKSAKDVIAEYPEADLTRIFRIYGEVDNPHKAAYLICRAREKSPIETTFQLNEALKPILPAFSEHKILAKIYQALRIEVNSEMRDLEKFLSSAAAALRPGGRLVVITYHSLEDRMVKNFIKTGNVEGEAVKDLYGNVNTPLEAVNRKPILPSEEEISSNTRARSAKLRVAVKL